MAGVFINNLTRQKVPRLPFMQAARAVLPGWEISLVFVGEKRALSLNARLRNKTYTPNVLSYVSGTKSGEIIICPQVAKRQAPEYGLSAPHYTLYLFIHGLLHLKGWAHGGRMEKYERALLARFAKVRVVAPHETTHRHRHRHRHVSGQNGRRRGDNR